MSNHFSLGKVSLNAVILGCILFCIAFLSNTGIVHAAEINTDVNATMKDAYPAAGSTIIESAGTGSDDILSVNGINEGVPITPAGFVKSGGLLFVIDQAKDRVISVDESSKAMKAFNYRTGQSDNFTPTDIEMTGKGLLVLTDHLVTLTARLYAQDGQTIKSYSIDPQLALEPLGIVNIKLISDDLWVQTSDGRYHQVVKNGQSVPYLAQTAITYNTLPSAIDGSLRFDVLKTGDRQAAVIFERSGAIDRVNFNFPEALNAILSFDELTADRYALTVLTGRQESAEMANDARDEVVVIVLDGSGAVISKVQLPYVNYLDGAFKIVQADLDSATLMKVGPTAAGLYEYLYE